jgi:ATP-binding cassette subfamily C protein
MKADTFFSLIKKESRSIKAPANQPVALDSSDSIWIVETGSVDLFAVSKNKSTQRVEGPRIYLGRMGENRILFGMESFIAEQQIKVIAVGRPDTGLAQLPLQRLWQAAEDDLYIDLVCDAVNEWVSTLSQGICNLTPPKQYNLIQAGVSNTFTNSQIVRTKQKLLWISHLSGRSRFLNSDQLEIKKNGYFPLSPVAWLNIEEDAKLHAVDTATFIRKKRIVHELNNFHGMVFKGISKNQSDANEFEQQRLCLKKKKCQAVFNFALTTLAKVLSKPENDLFRQEVDNILFNACRIVGKAQGIHFQLPAKTGMEDQPSLDLIARTAKVRFRQVILKGEWWHQDHGPLLSYRETDKRPMALIPLSSRSYELHDPVSGKKEKITLANKDTIAPLAYTFYRPFPEKKLSVMDMVKFGTSACKSDMWTILLMAVCGALLGLIVPVVTGILFDTIIPEAAENQLIQVGFILVACAVAAFMFEITKFIAMLRVEGKMDGVLQAALWDRLLGLPVPFFRRFTAGNLAERSMSINAMRQIISGATLQFLLAGLFSSFSIALLFWYDWQLALIAIALTISGLLFLVLCNYFQIKHQKEIFEIEGDIAGMVLQFISGIAKLRTSACENKAFSIWAVAFNKKKRIAFKVGTLSNIIAVFNASYPILCTGVIFYWVTYHRMEVLSTGDFLSFNAAYTNFQNAFIQLSLILPSLMKVKLLFNRAQPIFEAIPEATTQSQNPGELVGDIEVNHVNFSYQKEGPQILKDISMKINPGEFIAVVGGSGSGKSTLLRLLLGFETPASGTIFYGGQDLAALDIQAVRRQIGVVLQNGKLMTGDIFKNIVGSSHLTLEDAWEAARLAGIDQDIEAMPMKMHTYLTVGGGSLSGGQTQRLLIARAIVHKPSMLFFDEATSALDNRSQAVVSQSLEKLNTTRIVVAHRLSTIVNADRIYVMDRGRIVQTGAYADLIRQQGLFAELAKRQKI